MHYRNSLLTLLFFIIILLPISCSKQDAEGEKAVTYFEEDDEDEHIVKEHEEAALRALASFADAMAALLDNSPNTELTSDVIQAAGEVEDKLQKLKLLEKSLIEEYEELKIETKSIDKAIKAASEVKQKLETGQFAEAAPQAVVVIREAFQVALMRLVSMDVLEEPSQEEKREIESRNKIEAAFKSNIVPKAAIFREAATILKIIAEAEDETEEDETEDEEY